MTLVMFPEEDDWMMFVGHLQERCPEQPACKLVVGPGVSGSALSENLKLMLADFNTSEPMWFGCKFHPYVKVGSNPLTSSY